MGNDQRNAAQNAAPNDHDNDGNEDTAFSSALAKRLSPDPTWTSRPSSASINLEGKVVTIKINIEIY